MFVPATCLRGHAASQPTHGCTNASSIQTELFRAADPRDYALRLIVQESGAASGFLYRYDGRELQLVSASGHLPRDDKPEILQQALANDDLEGVTQYTASEPPPAPLALHCTCVLQIQRPDADSVFGGVILQRKPNSLLHIDTGRLSEIATALHDRELSTLD